MQTFITGVALSCVPVINNPFWAHKEKHCHFSCKIVNDINDIIKDTVEQLYHDDG